MRERPTHVPALGAPCPWWPAEASALGEPLQDVQTLDCAIVGAGYTGLACARRLAELRPSWRIGVLEALQVGQGASGRSSGYVMDMPHWGPSPDLELHRDMITLSRHGVRLLREAVGRHRIDCGWHEGGRFHVSVNQRGARALTRFRASLEALGEPFAPLPCEALAEALGTTHYTQGLYLRGGALVQPARLVRGLAAALPPSVQLFERTPITRIEPGPTRRLHAEHGEVETRRLVLATNGFSRAWGLARGRVLPVVTFASTTAPLPEPPGRLPQWGVVPEERMGSTVRLTAERQLLLRRGVRFGSLRELGPHVLARVATSHRRSLALRFPALGDVPFTHTWGGVLGVVRSGGPVFGEIGSGTFACGGHNGLGMALGTALGDVLAHLVADEPHPLLAQARRLPPPAWVPPEPLLSVGATATSHVMDLLAGTER